MGEDKEKPMTHTIGIFEKIMELWEKFGFFKLLMSTLFLVFFSYMSYLALNPEKIFEQYTIYISRIHQESTEIRRETAQPIMNNLNKLALELDADRAYIIEYHNGKSNATGLQWQYGDMTFVSENTDYIQNEFRDIEIIAYPLFYEIYKNEYWIGTREELEKLDPRMYYKLSINGTHSIAMMAIYSMSGIEIGVIGISYINNQELNKAKIVKILHKYTTCIGPLLDGEYQMSLKNKK